MTFKWNGDRVGDALIEATMKGAEAAANHYMDRLVTVLSLYDNQGPSLPGEPPHMQSLLAAKMGVQPLARTVKVVVDWDAMEVSIGTLCQYAVYLELGTSKMSPRPAWGRILNEELDNMEDVCNNMAQRWFVKNAGLPEVDDEG